MSSYHVSREVGNIYSPALPSSSLCHSNGRRKERGNLDDEPSHARWGSAAAAPLGNWPAVSPDVARPHLNLSQLLVSGAAVALGLAYLWGVVIPEELSRVSTGWGPFRHWDLETYFLPKFVFGSEEILRGRLPIWNRFEFGGIPFLATAQPAALYIPKILLFALWSPETALQLFLVLHFLLVGVLFLLFVRDQGIGHLGASIGVLYLTFNVPFLLSVGHPTPSRP